jgi:acetyltransferase-like isoleucine patch superfamily enzyme
MRIFITYIYKGFKRVYGFLYDIVSHFISMILFYLNGVRHGSFKTTGVPFLQTSISSVIRIGSGFSMHNSLKGNPIGRPQRCVFAADKNATILIGKNVGISCTVINCQLKISIGNNVMIGGGTCIYDSDFHQLDPEDRVHNRGLISKKEVIIGNNVFIGAHSLILKGVTIGNNSIIGAGSVVTKNVPANEIWAGNPARFITKVEINDLV